MARKFDTTNIVTPTKAPFSKRSLTHINTAYDELGEGIVNGMLGSYTTGDVVILHGCNVSATIPGTSSVTAGAIYYNGRVYEVDADASIITSGLQTLVWQIAESTITGDPATFDDGNTYDFHIIEKMELVNGLSGSGLANYDAVVQMATPYKNTAGTVTASSNLTSTSARVDGFKKGNLFHGVAMINATVTTGASASSISITLPADIDFYETYYNLSDYPTAGMIHLTQSSGANTLSLAISNGSAATDCWVEVAGKLNVTLAGGLVPNGSAVKIVVQFTAQTSN